MSANIDQPHFPFRRKREVGHSSSVAIRAFIPKLLPYEHFRLAGFSPRSSYNPPECTPRFSMTTAKIGDKLWIYNPWLDLVVGCGAWSAPLLLLAYFVADSSTLLWAVGFYGLALFLNYPHYMATLYRAYHTREDFNQYRVFTVHFTGLMVATLLLSHFWFRGLPWIFTLYLTLSPWHYSGQNYGLFMMFARRAGARPSKAQRRALYAAFIFSYLVLFVNFHTGASADPMFVSLGIPAQMSSALLVGLAAGFLVSASFGLFGLIGQVGWRPMLPSLTLFSTQFVWFLLPTALSLGDSLQIPQSRYSNGVLAVMHSAQYLWITSYFARREATAEAAKNWRPAAYFGLLIAGGIALFVPGPWLASRIFHSDFGASFLIFTALVNIHHFILDGAIWKLRDRRVSSLLVSSQGRLSAATAIAANRTAVTVRWLAGASSGARMLRGTAAIFLLTLGGVDQVRHYFLQHEDNVSDLQRAAALDPFDTSLEMKLGRKELELGHPDLALAAWQKAVQANPADAATRDEVLKYMTGQKRFAEAYSLTQLALHYTPNDANLLVNHGILANQLALPEQAIDSWKKAIALDSNQRSAELYLAAELDREGRADTAIPHYMNFLQQVAKSGQQNRPPARNLIPVVLQLAKCQEQSSRILDARKAYQLAERIAAESGDSELESLASASHAKLEAGQHNPAAALALYQRALNLDRTNGDRRNESIDWYDYALYLRDAGFPARLVYACLLKSQNLISSADASQLKLVASTSADAGKVLGAQAASIRHNPDLLTEEALHLTVAE
jgi:tetratricopeptide (TPR) repeat protein